MNPIGIKNKLKSTQPAIGSINSCLTDTSVAVGPGNSVHAATRAIEHCTRPFANVVVAHVALLVAANDVLGVNPSAVQILGERGGTRPCVPVTVIRLHRWRTLVSTSVVADCRRW